MVAGPMPAVETVDPSEVSPGDRGICTTEVEDGRLVEIPVTVLGIVGTGQPEGEMVLIRLDDPRFEDVGVAAGMSGSPVMVGGRLLGALAFGWQFSSAPIAGVTPFSRMRELGRTDAGAAAARAAGSRPELMQLVESGREGRLDEVVLDWLAPESPGRRNLPLVVAGAGPGLALGGDGWSAALRDRMGWVTAPGGGTGRTSAPSGPLKPGSMIAAVLVRGDASLSAGGTVTAVEGDEVWAFGHPFLGAGDVAMPMARASVVTILPSLASSFKMFSAGETIGAIRSDRRHGVWGRLGDDVEMVPLTVRTGDASYRFEILRHEVLTPLLAGILVAGAQQVRGRSFGMQTIDLSLGIDLAGGDRLDLSQVFDGGDAPTQAAAWTSAVIGYLTASPFASDDIGSLSISLESVEGLDRATVLDVTPDRRVVQPGEALGIRVRLKRPGSAVETVRMELNVPEEVGAGKIDLVVADGASWTAYDLKARPSRSADFEDEVRLLGRLRTARELVAVFEIPGASLVLSGGTVAAPIGTVATLRSAMGSELQTAKYRVVSRTSVDTGGPVAAATRIRLTVRTQSGLTGDR